MSELGHDAIDKLIEKTKRGEIVWCEDNECRVGPSDEPKDFRTKLSRSLEMSVYKGHSDGGTIYISKSRQVQAQLTNKKVTELWNAILEKWKKDKEEKEIASNHLAVEMIEKFVNSA